MSEPVAPTPQLTPQERKLQELEDHVEKSWATLTSNIVALAKLRHRHLTITHRAHEYTAEQIWAAASAHRQSESDASAALEVCVLAQIALMREIDSHITPE